MRRITLYSSASQHAARHRCLVVFCDTGALRQSVQPLDYSLWRNFWQQYWRSVVIRSSETCRHQGPATFSCFQIVPVARVLLYCRDLVHWQAKARLWDREVQIGRR